MFSSKKTVILYTTLPEVGGSSTIALELVRFFRHYGFSVVIIVRAQDDSKISEGIVKALEDLGCQVELLSDPQRSALRDGIKALRICRKRKAHLFISIGMGFGAPLLALLGGFRRRCFYYINHDPRVEPVRRLGPFLWVFDTIIVISPASIAPVESLLHDKKRVLWLPQFSEMSEVPVPDLSEKTGPLRFGFIGNLKPEKGVGRLLKIWEQGMNEAELHILGDGMLRAEVEKIAREVKGIHYHGSFTTSDRAKVLPTFLDNLDYVLVPSIGHGEGLPTVILEGLSRGVPCISTPGGGTIAFTGSILREDFGQFVQLISEEKFANAIRNITRRPLPAERVACVNVYLKWFSTLVLERQWLKVADSESSAAR